MPITSSGLNTHISSPVSVDGKTQYDITGGTRVGANLFHSFGNLDVPQNTIANFHNESMHPTDNILGRVTGNSVSDILGTIKTTEFGGANLFLMNPAGFLFGPNASLHVGGAVAFTSAEYLRLSNEAQTGYFYTDPANPSLLTPWPVAAFGFLGSSPGAITVQGSQLKVTEGASLSLVGGNIIIESAMTNGAVRSAQLLVPNGNLHLATTVSPGEFPADINAFSLVEPLANIDGHSFAAFGAITLTPNSTVNVSGTNTVSIRGGHFVLSLNDTTLSTTDNTVAPNFISLKPTSLIISANDGSMPGANIQISTATLQMDRAEIITRSTGIGNAGAIEVHAQNSINITDSSMSSASEGQNTDAGAGGDILLHAPSIDITDSTLSAVTVGPGNAGNISLRANALQLVSVDPKDLKSTEISATTSGPGHGGNISILGITGSGSRVQDVTLSGLSSLRSETLNGTGTGTGTAGNISLDARRLSLMEKSIITTASRDSDPSHTNSGNAGNITLNTTESIHISQSLVTSDVSEASTGTGGHIVITTPILLVEDGGFISTSTTSSGNAGTVTINSRHMTLAGGGQVTSTSSLEDLIPPPTGAAGTVIIQGVEGPGSRASSISISGKGRSGVSSGIVTDTQGTGAGGNITLEADQAQLDDGAQITANSSEGGSNAGNITITATNGFSMKQNSNITTSVSENSTGGNSGGGNIKITTSPSATIHLQNSTISASVGDGRGGGGNISIDPQLIILQGSNILAQADEGRGGQISITAGVFLPDANSVINADSGSGVNGTVTIQSPTSNLSGTVGQLVSKTSPPQALLHSRCAALVGGRESTFILAGRGTLPSEPGGWLLSPLTLAGSEADGSMMSSVGLHTRDSRKLEASPFVPMRHIVFPELLTQPVPIEWLSNCKP
ncbi:two-partner secretion domain-containing protein [Candidatus Nitrospira nitrosa]|nr:filamentous hemagglutinin N-terminal domain-containing protein [Candidatus Nitrospira nitrosa]